MNMLQKHILSTCMSDTSGEYPDTLTGSIPEAKSGVTGSHIFALKLPLTGHCY